MSRPLWLSNISVLLSSRNPRRERNGNVPRFSKGGVVKVQVLIRIVGRSAARWRHDAQACTAIATARRFRRPGRPWCLGWSTCTAVLAIELVTIRCAPGTSVGAWIKDVHLISDDFGPVHLLAGFAVVPGTSLEPTFDIDEAPLREELLACFGKAAPSDDVVPLSDLPSFVG